MGVFYPKGYLLAVFNEVESADNAAKAIQYLGISADDVIVVPGHDLLRHTREHIVK